VVDVVAIGFEGPGLLALVTGTCRIGSDVGGRGFEVVLGTVVLSLESDSILTCATCSTSSSSSSELLVLRLRYLICLWNASVGSR
jgi:hypothetical protein